jgi:hypothetical protein
VTADDRLWAVGSYVGADGTRRPWPISAAEIDRDIGSATAVLAELDVAGRGVLWCSMLAEAGQFWPYICGTVLAGGRLSCADATEGEAVRVAMFLARMPYEAVFGVTPAILDGLDAAGTPYHDVFAGVRLVGARPGAYERLRAAGVRAVRFAVCGPAVAIGRTPGGPAYPVAQEWEVCAEDGRIHVTARRPRAEQFVRTPTGVHGHVVDGGVSW